MGPTCSSRQYIWDQCVLNPGWQSVSTQSHNVASVLNGPYWHEGNSAVQWQLLGAIRNPQWRHTRLRPCSTALWDFICPVAKTCIRQNNRRNLLSYPLRWQALQPRPSQSQDKGTQGSHQESAVCWWRSSCDPHPGGTPVIDGLLLTCQ